MIELSKSELHIVNTCAIRHARNFQERALAAGESV